MTVRFSLLYNMSLETFSYSRIKGVRMTLYVDELLRSRIRNP